jgi:hypothetical protein
MRLPQSNVGIITSRQDVVAIHAVHDGVDTRLPTTPSTSNEQRCTLRRRRHCSIPLHALCVVNLTAVALIDWEDTNRTIV